MEGGERASIKTDVWHLKQANCPVVNQVLGSFWGGMGIGEDRHSGFHLRTTDVINYIPRPAGTSL